MIDVGWATLRNRHTWPLIFGDVLSFVFFSALGHRSHDQSGAVVSVLGTAFPFIAGWLAVAPWLGAYRVAPGLPAGTILRRTAVAWLAAWPVTLILRAILLRRGIPVSFALVVLFANAVLLISWRGMFIFLQRRKAHR